MKTRYKWFAGLILLGVLLAGLGIGSAATVFVLGKRVPPHPPADPSFGRAEGPYANFVLRRMNRELELAPRQRAAIREEMTAIAERFRQLHDETREELRTIAVEGHNKILQHLSEEQAAQYRARLKDRFPMQRGFGPPGPHGPHPRGGEFRERRMQRDGRNPPPPPEGD